MYLLKLYTSKPALWGKHVCSLATTVIRGISVQPRFGLMFLCVVSFLAIDYLNVGIKNVFFAH